MNERNSGILRPKILYLLIRYHKGKSVWGYQLASGLKLSSWPLFVALQPGVFICKSEQAIMNYSHHTFFCTFVGKHFLVLNAA